jgi:hypothetical protein
VEEVVVDDVPAERGVVGVEGGEPFVDSFSG